MSWCAATGAKHFILLLAYVRHDPRTFWDLFWVFAWEGNEHAINWLCAHIVPQLLPRQEPFCRRALQAIIDSPAGTEPAKSLVDLTEPDSADV